MKEKIKKWLGISTLEDQLNNRVFSKEEIKPSSLYKNIFFYETFLRQTSLEEKIGELNRNQELILKLLKVEPIHKKEDTWILKKRK